MGRSSFIAPSLRQRDAGKTNFRILWVSGLCVECRTRVDYLLARSIQHYKTIVTYLRPHHRPSMSL